MAADGRDAEQGQRGLALRSLETELSNPPAPQEPDDAAVNCHRRPNSDATMNP